MLNSNPALPPCCCGDSEAESRLPAPPHSSCQSHASDKILPTHRFRHQCQASRQATSFSQIAAITLVIIQLLPGGIRPVSGATNLIDCEFRNSLCYWTQSYIDDLNWAHFARPSSSRFPLMRDNSTEVPHISLPNIGPQNRSDYFVYVESQRNSFGKRARLVSEWVPAVRHRQDEANMGYCLHFMYYMFNPEGLSTLRLLVRNETRQEIVVWSSLSDSHSMWLAALVKLDYDYNFRLIFDGTTGGNARDVAISHVSLNEGSCYDVIEGDILVPSVAQADNHLNAAIANDDYLWPNGVIPYVIDGDFADSERNMLLRAFEDYGQRTCIRFQRRVDESDYIYIKKVQDALCSSSAGRQLGMQLVRLNSGCFWRYGTIVHELMHAIGFWHEQNRPDRDSYVNIVWDNILWYARENFKKLDPKFATDSGTPYDYESVMHYGASDFSKAPNLITIVPRKEGMTIGQRNGLSNWDVREINRLYKCPLSYDHGYGTAAPTVAASVRSAKQNNRYVSSYVNVARSLRPNQASSPSSAKVSGEKARSKQPVLLPMSPVVRPVALTLPYISVSKGFGVYPYRRKLTSTSSTTTTSTSTTSTTTTTTTTTPKPTTTTTKPTTTTELLLIDTQKFGGKTAPYLYPSASTMPRLVVGVTTPSGLLIPFTRKPNRPSSGVHVTLFGTENNENPSDGSTEVSAKSRRRHSSATCSFEQTWCGWISDESADFSWDVYGPYSANSVRQRQASMPSIDHTRGDSSGHYAYTMTGQPQKRGQRARLLSRYFSYDINCITFSFSVNGVDAGILRMVVVNPGLEEDVIWEARGNFGDSWLSGQAPIIAKGPFFRIAFEAEAGEASFGGTIALDDVQLSFSPNTCQLGPTDADDDFCDFESGNFCAWKNSFGDIFDWQLNRGPTPSYGTGPSFDHTFAGSSETKGSYAFVEGSSPQKRADKARITKALMKNSASYCLQFWYFMYGSQMGCLRVFHEKSNHEETLLWERCGQQGARWINAELNVNNDKAGSHIIIEAEVGDGFQSDIAIDDLYVKSGSCPFDAKMLFCTFDVDMCSWKEDARNKARWKKHNPGDGHESRENRDEHFYYLLGGSMMDNVWESSRLVSQAIPSGKWCFVFYYRMNGWYKQPDQLAIIQSNANGEESLVKAIIANPAQNSWVRESVTIVARGSFNIIIDSRQGKTFIGYTAIDEVGLTRGQCPPPSTHSRSSMTRSRRSTNVADHGLSGFVQQFL